MEKSSIQFQSELRQTLAREEALESFIQNRLGLIRENRYPIELSSETSSRYIMHIVPADYLTQTLDIKQFAEPQNYFSPHSKTDIEHIVPDFNFDGIFFCTSMHEKHGYTQVFRNGIIETVIAAGQYSPETGNNISLLLINRNTIKRISEYVKILDHNQVKGPYTLYFRMIGMDGIKLNPNDIAQSGYDSKGHTNAIILEEILFPKRVIRNAEANIFEAVKPLFDIFWNSFGYAGAPEIEPFKR